MKGVNSLLLIFAMVIVIAGMAVVNTLPDYFTDTHKLLLYAIVLIAGGVVASVSFK